MKKFSQKILAITSVAALTLSLSVHALAAEETIREEHINIALENSISPLSSIFESSGIAIYSSKWTTIATSTSGFNCNVQVNTLNATLPPTNHIRMLGKDGNVVWQENSAISYSNSRVFWCGSDVYEIQIRCSSGVGTASCWPTNKPTN